MPDSVRHNPAIGFNLRSQIKIVSHVTSVLGLCGGGDALVIFYFVLEFSVVFASPLTSHASASPVAVILFEALLG